MPRKSQRRSLVTKPRRSRVGRKSKSKSRKKPHELTELFRTGERDEVLRVFGDGEVLADHKGKYGETALHWAAYCGDSELIKALLEKKIAKEEDFNDQDSENRRTPLNWALVGFQERVGRINFLKKKIDETKKPNEVKNYQDQLKKHEKVQELSEELIGGLYEEGVDLHARDRRLQCPASRIVSLKNQGFLDSIKLESGVSSEDNIAKRSELISEIAKPHGGYRPERDGEDSSDEEMVEEMRALYQSAEQSWKRFECSIEMEELVQTLRQDGRYKNKTYGHICGAVRNTFFLHAKGIELLYGEKVNDWYYDELKWRLGECTVPEEDVLKSWFKAALEKTVQTIFNQKHCTGHQIERIVSFVDELLKIKHTVISSAKLLDADERIRDYYVDLFRSDKQAQEAIKQAGKGTAKGAQAARNFSSTLTRDGSLDEATKLASSSSLASVREEAASLDRYLSAANKLRFIDRDFWDHHPDVRRFDLVFFKNLREERVTWEKNHDQLADPYPELVPGDFPDLGGPGLFATVRMRSRYEKRQRRKRASLANQILRAKPPKLSEEVLYYPVSGRFVTVLSEITTNFVRNMKVAGESTYEAVCKSIDTIGKVCGIDDKRLAELIRRVLTREKFDDLLEGISPGQLDLSDLIPVISRVFCLLFVVEPTRNPAAFIANQMLLEMVEDGQMTWEEALSDKEGSGYMIMVQKGAVSTARYLHRLFADFMPYPYDYEGGRLDYVEEKDKKLRRLFPAGAKQVADLIFRCDRMVSSWKGFKEFKASSEEPAKRATEQPDVTEAVASMGLGDQVESGLCESDTQEGLIDDASVCAWYPGVC